MTRISRWLPATTLTFGLAASGLVFIAPSHAQQVDPEPDTGLLTEWNYLDDGTDPANGLEDRTGWTDPEFDDSSWDNATGSFGARSGELSDLSGGYRPDNLLDQYYPETTDNKEAFFFRADFTVEATDIEDYILNGAVRYDDAVTIFVNGERIAGFHDDGLEFAEEGDDRNMVFGGSNSGTPILEQFTVPAEALEVGENTIAVQLHQGREGSSDVYFDMESFAFQDAPLADARTPWNYLDNGTDPSDGLENRTDWADPAFDDSDWATSEGGSFGSTSDQQAELSGGFYPDNLLAQHYDTGENKEAHFFRTNLNIESAQLGENTVLRGSIRYDDAAIIYVNGQRVAGFDDSDLEFSEEGERRNMVFGGSNAGAPQRGEFVVPNGVLEAGENTIAVQIHQGRPASSDIYFGLESLDFDEFVPTNDGQTTIMMHMGADNSERRLSWVTDSQTPEGVELAAGAHDTMPEDAEVIEATEQDSYVEYGREYVHATLSDLTEGTYSYRVGSDVGGWSDVEQFEVYPNDVEHEFTFIGDAQLGSSGNVASDGAGWQAALDANDELFPESQFVLSAGDQVETYSGRMDEYQAYINPQQMRTQPSAATLGNHDYTGGSPQALYGMHYNQPNLADYDSSRGSYWFMYNDVLHLNISTENRNWDDHREFLETTIEEHGDDAHWTMLTFHRPLYSAGNHSVTGTTNDMRDGLSPIINDLDIDVVLTGHDHSYSRSFLIDSEGNQVDPATSEAIVNEDGDVAETPQPTEGDEPNIGYEGRDSSPRLDDGNHIRVTPEAGDTLFVTANSSSGSKYYPLQDASNYRDGFEARFRDQSYEQNITGVEVDQCSITTNTVELDGTVVDKVELFRDNSEPTIRNIDNVTVTLGEEFDPLADIDVFDDCAVLSPDDVDVEGEVDTTALGEYTLTYSVVDAAGNETSVERVVTVAEATEEPTEEPSETPEPTEEPSEEPTEDPSETPTETPEPTETPGVEDDETPGAGDGNDDGDDETPAAGGNGDENDESPSPQPTATDGAETVADSGDRDSGVLASTGATITAAVAIGLAAIILGLMLFMVKRNRERV